MTGHNLGAFDQSRPEHRMGQIGPRFGEVRDRVRLGYGAAPEPGDLGEDEPHPVAGLAALAQLADGLTIGLVRVLGKDEPVEIHRI